MGFDVELGDGELVVKRKQQLGRRIKQNTITRDAPIRFVAADSVTDYQ